MNNEKQEDKEISLLNKIYKQYFQIIYYLGQNDEEWKFDKKLPLRDYKLFAKHEPLLIYKTRILTKKHLIEVGYVSNLFNEKENFMQMQVSPIIKNEIGFYIKLQEEKINRYEQIINTGKEEKLRKELYFQKKDPEDYKNIRKDLELVINKLAITKSNIPSINKYDSIYCETISDIYLN